MTTITEQQFDDLWHACRGQKNEFRERLPEIGITIAPPEPPEAMVKLAREIAVETAGVDNDYTARRNAALAALQYADKVVRERFDCGSVTPGSLSAEDRDAIRRKLGAL